MGQSRPLFVYFRPFLIAISIIQDVCLGFEPGSQNGRRRRNHGAMAATHLTVKVNLVNTRFIHFILVLCTTRLNKKC